MSARYKLFRRFMLALGWLLFGFTIHGAEKVPKEGSLIVAANHRRYADPVFVPMAVPRRIQWMAKKELFVFPLVRFFFFIGAFPVDRQKGGRAALRTALDLLAAGWALGIFPEGTRRKGYDPEEAPKSGVAVLATRGNAPVLPVFVGKVNGDGVVGRLPVVAIVGAPNVGKSTFVNRVLGRRQAVVADEPGTTRDRSYNRAEWAGREFLLVDTGGMEPLARSGLEALVTLQARVAVEEADVILHLADAGLGVTEADAAIAKEIRRGAEGGDKKVVLVVNKLDNPADDSGRYPFYSLGEGEPHAISAAHGLGTGDLLDVIVSLLPEGEPAEGAALPSVAVIGRPNVGKSTLLNRLLGTDRAV